MSDAIQLPEGLTTEGLLGRRYLARFIDSILMGFLAAMMLGLGQVIFGLTGVSGIGIMLLNLQLILIGWLSYSALLESSPWQATLGKKLLKLRVYDSRGGRMSFLQAAMRSLVKDSPFLLAALLPGGQLLSIALLGAHAVVLHRSSVHQAIHDRVTGTLVAAPEATIQLRLT
jgi:uncharacterized RDD family membrane protein YckC